MPVQTLRESENLLQRQLERAVKALRDAANNKTCGGCAHACLGGEGTGFCAIQSNYEGNALQIYRREACACSCFKAA